MARIDYYAIETNIKAALAADATLTGVMIVVEEQPNFGDGPLILIAMDRRDAPEGQPIAAGKRTRMRMRVRLWCFGTSLHIPDAMQARDDLIGKVEIALMNARSTLADQIGQYWITGGEFETSKGGAGFVCGGSVDVAVETTAIA